MLRWSQLQTLLVRNGERRWLCSTRPPQNQTEFTISEGVPLPQSPITFHYTASLLDTIMQSPQSYHVKQKRALNAIAKLNGDIVSSFALTSVATSNRSKPDQCLHLLRSLSRVRPLLVKHEDASVSSSLRRSASSRAGAAADALQEPWTAASPFFSLEMNDVLCLCLRECVYSNEVVSSQSFLELLSIAVLLELGDTVVLQHIIETLTKPSECRRRSLSDQVELLRLISLAVKRCKLPQPRLDRVLCVLPGSVLSSRASLVVLSSLLRLRYFYATDVIGSVSRKAVHYANDYTAQDVVFALEVCALLPGCNEVFAGSVLNRCAALAPSFTPKQLGTCCKYIALLNPSRRTSSIASTCSSELRALLPMLVERAVELLGEFNLREAQCVLRCFREHHVRHSLIFSKLTPIAGDY